MKVSLRKDKWGCDYPARVSYQGKVLKRYKQNSRCIYKTGEFIIKIEPEEDFRFQTAGEIRFYKRLTKASPAQRKYFPKLIASDSERGIIVQEFIDLGYNRTKKHRDIVEQLIKIHNIESDVHSHENYNWAINKKNDLPVIYDLGFA